MRDHFGTERRYSAIRTDGALCIPITYEAHVEDLPAAVLGSRMLGRAFGGALSPLQPKVPDQEGVLRRR